MEMIAMLNGLGAAGFSPLAGEYAVALANATTVEQVDQVVAAILADTRLVAQEKSALRVLASERRRAIGPVTGRWWFWPAVLGVGAAVVFRKQLAEMIREGGLNGLAGSPAFDAAYNDGSEALRELTAYDRQGRGDPTRYRALVQKVEAAAKRARAAAGDNTYYRQIADSLVVQANTMRGRRNQRVVEERELERRWALQRRSFNRPIYGEGYDRDPILDSAREAGEYPPRRK